MFKIGDAKICDERREVMNQGFILAMIPGDHIHRLWLGAGEGADLLMAHWSGQDGCQFVMGRVRIHKDDKTHDSKDEKQSTRLAFGPMIPSDKIQIGIDGMLTVANQYYDIVRVHEATVDGDNARFMEVLKEAGRLVGGWDISEKAVYEG